MGGARDPWHRAGFQRNRLALTSAGFVLTGGELGTRQTPSYQTVLTPFRQSARRSFAVGDVRCRASVKGKRVAFAASEEGSVGRFRRVSHRDPPHSEQDARGGRGRVHALRRSRPKFALEAPSMEDEERYPSVVCESLVMGAGAVDATTVACVPRRA